MAQEISKDMIRGLTGAIVLSVLEFEDSYGYQISKQIKQITDDRYELNEATLYTVFRRLSAQGFVKSYYGNDDENQGGRRKYYSLTESGKKELNRSRTDWEFSKEIVDALLQEKKNG
ncbi:PadR family transcriptional regulator [Oenococcus kitaharae]|uniref:PadR family transcriptional regulator n=1 Tax=Oenococcus kitaharae DSM 17330 TaxID=1045004 RepID=G9WJ02_9LACO|nr:PadR family transcriptional regulator [Oenococcus kitaharae]EHN58451.1 PadR family transcriptional regulator [Oenococcus kitaharae DSM 17330]MCV3296310.1 PadR family transcriptional regulator [Oenococcus kitaharae]OEY81393.1 PadR family transcriptional regulator [Oenococcus kitaharae]OEY82881.1 PadR family transcriptional regulator [Oenococcus kitaharae]OEY84575.1 PadR family transcriptional regulator [Oenococcus kitaharae]